MQRHIYWASVFVTSCQLQQSIVVYYHRRRGFPAVVGVCRMFSGFVG